MIKADIATAPIADSKLLFRIAETLLLNLSEDSLRPYLEQYFDTACVEEFIQNKRTYSLASQVYTQELLDDASKLAEFRQVALINFQDIKKSIRIAGLLKNADQIFQWLTNGQGQHLLTHFSHEDIYAALELDKTIKLPFDSETIIDPDKSERTILQDGQECFIAWVSQFPNPIKRIFLLISGISKLNASFSTKQHNLYCNLFKQVISSQAGERNAIIN